jgi:hypothetical protein
MEIEFQLYVWLIEHSILNETNLSYSPIKTLDTSFASQFKNGVVACRLLESLRKRLSLSKPYYLSVKLKDVIDTVYREEIQSNWNNIISDLEVHFKIKLDAQMKKLLASGDEQIISEIYNILYEKYGQNDTVFQDQLKMLRNYQPILAPFHGYLEDDEILDSAGELLEAFPRTSRFYQNLTPSRLTSGHGNSDHSLKLNLSKISHNKPSQRNVLLTQPQDHSINPSKSSEPPTDKKFPTMLSPIGEHRPSPGVLDHSLNTVNLNQYLGDETKYLIDEFHQGKSKLFSPENFNDISLLIPNQQLEPIDFSRINPKTALGKTQKVSEFIVLSLSKHIRLKPENIVQFLVEKSKLLTMVIVSGIKGDYRPIIHFYEDIFTYLENLMKMALSDGSLATVKSLINTIKPGFVSKSEEIAKWTCRIFSKMAYICHKEQILDRAFEIFIEEGTFIKILLLCIRRHFELKTAVLEVLTEFGKENFVTLFEIHLRANLAEGATYLKFTYEYLEQLFGTPKTWEYIDNNYTVENWIKEIFKYTKFVISNSNETRMYSFYVIIDIWMKYPNFMINS